jgi:LPXTG-site transpeptidase (sortase) family protein
MEGLIHAVAQLIRAANRAYARKWSFLVLSVFVFLLSVYLLAALDLLPDPAAPAPTVSLSSSPLVAAGAEAPAIPASEAPVKIEIPSISLSATIANPTTTDIEALDQLLLKGAVRYPTSAKLNEDGNVVLFGHSSYLPIVKNQAYKTFDGIQKLSAGDTITVYSSDAAYTYSVRSVQKESAESAAIPLSVSGKVLTLSTCDSFGAKTDRFIVTADFVGSHPLTGALSANG